MWVNFVILDACIIFGCPAIAIIVVRMPDRVRVRRMVKDLDKEYQELTARSRRDV